MEGNHNLCTIILVVISQVLFWSADSFICKHFFSLQFASLIEIDAHKNID